MSEYQYVEFRAVDRPLTDAELDFAEKQSTRAEITRWSFQNEYHYGDFHGDVNGLLRRGYDVYLHYANFGVRTAGFRLPAGLPFSKTVWAPYFRHVEMSWKKDSKGEAGILLLRPFHEPDTIEQIWEPGEYMEDFVELRSRLIAGDLRALYVLWLCAAFDEQSVDPEIVEPPVPAGLSQGVEIFGDFLAFFGLDPLILAAAAEAAPEAFEPPALKDQHGVWVEKLSPAQAKGFLRRLMSEEAAAVKAEMIAAARSASESPDWPTVSPGRTLEALLERTEQLRAAEDDKERKRQQAAAKRAAAKKERERQQRMKQMAQEPEPWLRQATKLVDERGTDNYAAAAEILAELRDALGGDEGAKIARAHAAHLAQKNPTLSHLKSSLRKQGLWG